MRLRVASTLHHRGDISQDQKALLKDLVIAGDRHLEDLLQNYESDNNPGPLLAFLRSPQAQAAKARANSNLMDSLASGLATSMSMDGGFTRPGGLGSMDVLMMAGIGEEPLAPPGNSGGAGGAGGRKGSSSVSFDMDFSSNQEQSDISHMFDDGFDDPLNDLFGLDGRGSMDMNVDALMHHQLGVSTSGPAVPGGQAQRFAGAGAAAAASAAAADAAAAAADAAAAPSHSASVPRHSRAVTGSGSLGLIGFDMAKEARLRRFRRSFSDALPNAVELYDLLADPDCGVTVKERTKRKVFKTERFPPCFVGSEAVGWMTENIPMLYDDRQQALYLGRMLVRARLVAHVKNSKDFEDSPTEYYTFQKSRVEVGLPTTATSAAIAAASTRGVGPGGAAGASAHTRDFSIEEQLASLSEFYRNEDEKRQQEHDQLLKDQKKMHQLQLAQHQQRLQQIQMEEEQRRRETVAAEAARAAAQHAKTKTIGAYNMTERKALLNKWFEKRARMKKNRLEGKSHQYMGRTKFANARPRVKGRFVPIKFMDDRGIKFISEKSGWVCATLGGKVFASAHDAVEAVDAANGGPPPQWADHFTKSKKK